MVGSTSIWRYHISDPTLGRCDDPVCNANAGGLEATAPRGDSPTAPRAGAEQKVSSGPLPAADRALHRDSSSGASAALSTAAAAVAAPGGGRVGGREVGEMRGYEDGGSMEHALGMTFAFPLFM